MTKRLEIRDTDYRVSSSPDGWSVRYDVNGREIGWSRLGYHGGNAYLLTPPVAFYVDFDRNGVPQRFVDCGKRDGQYWAQLFGYGAEPTPLWDATDYPRVPVAEPKCNNPEPEPAPAASDITDITRSFCR